MAYPTALVVGRHELRVERAWAYNRVAGIFFAVEGHVLHSTAREFAGVAFFYVCSMGNMVGHGAARSIARASSDLTIVKLVNYAAECAKRGASIEESPKVVDVRILAECNEVENRAAGRRLRTTRFTEAV